MSDVFPLIEIATIASKTRATGFNEDATGYCSFDLRQSDCSQRISVICLADGMTTLASPHLASSYAVQAAMRAFFLSSLPWKERTVQMVIEANDRLLNDPTKCDFGSTLTSMIVSNKSVHIANLGDDRVYHISKSTITCLTQDHSSLAVKLGRNPNKVEVKGNKKSKNLARSLGEKSFDADYVFTHTCTVETGDLLLVCTDGLWTEFDEEELLSLLMAKITAPGLAEIAMNLDDTDDISAVLLRF